MGYKIDDERSLVVTDEGKDVCYIYEPQALLEVPSRHVLIVVGHEEVIVIDTVSNGELARTFTR